MDLSIPRKERRISIELLHSTKDHRFSVHFNHNETNICSISNHPDEHREKRSLCD